MIELVVAFAVGLILIGVVLKLMSLPFKLFWKLLTNSIVGAIMLWIVTLFGIPIKINIVSALVAGFFGVPGIIAVIAYTYL